MKCLHKIHTHTKASQIIKLTCCVQCEGEEGQLQEFILAQMHPLYDITAIIEHPLNILRIHGTCEVRIAVMFTITRRRTDALIIIKNNRINSNA